MEWRDACDADKSGQAYRKDDEGFWTAWTVGEIGDAIMERVTGGQYEERTVTLHECEQHDDWKPVQPIDAVTRLGDLER